MLAFILLPLDSAVALYTVLFMILVLSGIGLPVPEEITLLLGGYLAYLEFIKFWPAVYVLIAGIILGDMLGYFFGRFTGNKLSAIVKYFRMTAPLLDKTEFYFKKHGEKIVIFSRPLVGVRVIVPMLAGHFKMNLTKFLLYDFIAAVPWAFFLTSLSYYLGSGLDLITEIKEIKHVIFVLIGVAVLFYAAIKFINNNPPRE